MSPLIKAQKVASIYRTYIPSFEQDNSSTEVLRSQNVTSNLDEENYDFILRSKKSTASFKLEKMQRLT